MPTSAPVFFEVIPTPLEESGWEVRVRSKDGFSTLLAIIPKWKELLVGPELSNKGAGSVTFSLEDVLFQEPLANGQDAEYLLKYEHLWEAAFEGHVRFQWLASPLEDIPEDGEATVTMAGDGIAKVLEWAVVFPSGFPNQPAPTNPTDPVGQPTEFPVEPMFKIYRELLAQAQRRGTIPYVTPTFSDTTDSGGVAWDDLTATSGYPVFADTGAGRPTFKPELGKNLFELLTQFSGRDVDTITSTVVVDWVMREGFRLDVRKTIGSRLENAVVFHLSGSAKSIQHSRIRDEVRNLVVVQDDLGAYSIASDANSVDKFGQREIYLAKNGPQAESAVLRPQVAAVLLEQHKDELSSWTIVVDGEQEGRRPFIDYNIGDWVGVETLSGPIEAFRVLVLAVKVDENGRPEVELTLQSKLEYRDQQLQRQLNQLLTTVDNLPFPDSYFPPDFPYDEFPYLGYDPSTGLWGPELPMDFPGIPDGGFPGGGDGIGTGGGVQVFIQHDDPGAEAKKGDLWLQI